MTLPEHRAYTVQETDYRIRNILQVLIRLQNRLVRQRDGQVELTTLLGLGAQLKALAHMQTALNEASHDGTVVAQLDMASYLVHLLCRALATAFEIDERQLTVNMRPWIVPAALAQALGSLVAELVINALQHVFAGNEIGTVSVTCGSDAGG